MNTAITAMAKRIEAILGENLCCFLLYGSVTLDDFRPGWSDIDFLCLTNRPLTTEEAEALLYLRQLMEQENRHPGIYRLFEGIFTSAEEFLKDRYQRVVYWGTSGQRITAQHTFDPCSLVQVIHHGVLILGTDLRARMIPPTAAAMKAQIHRHYLSIRQHAVTTDESLYSCGWLLDIARCIYTLRHKEIISKTAAGYWALQEGICPVEEDLLQTLKVRCNPLRYKEDKETLRWLSQLGPSVQRYADVLQAELCRDTWP